MNLHNYKAKIIPKHLDFMGHVNHASYLQLLEEARWHIYDYYDHSQQKFINEKKGPVVLEVNIKYRKEILLNETINIETKCLEYRGPLGKMRQIIRKENGKISCSAEIVFALFDLKTRKLIPPEGAWKKFHQTMMN